MHTKIIISSLLCVTMIQAEIYQSLFQGRACTTHVGQTLKLQSAVVTLNIRSMS